MVEKRKPCIKGNAKQSYRKVKQSGEDLDDQEDKEDEELEEILVTMGLLDD